MRNAKHEYRENDPRAHYSGDKQRAWGATRSAFVERLTGRKFEANPPDGFDQAMAIAMQVKRPETVPWTSGFISTRDNPSPSFRNHQAAFEQLRDAFEFEWSRHAPPGN